MAACRAANFARRQPVEVRIGVGLDPWRRVEQAFEAAADEVVHGGHEPLCCFVSQASGAVEREVALRPFDHRAVRHHARVAHSARKQTNLDLALLPNHIAVERQRSVTGQWCAGLLVPASGRAGTGRCRMRRYDRRQWARRTPTRRRQSSLPAVFSLAASKDDLWLLPFEPVDIPGRLLARVVDGVALVDRANGDAVVVGRRNLHRAGVGHGERHLQGGDRLIVPCPRYGDRRAILFRRGKAVRTLISSSSRYRPATEDCAETRTVSTQMTARMATVRRHIGITSGTERRKHRSVTKARFRRQRGQPASARVSSSRIVVHRLRSRA